mgnify:CR=1 FL=1
MCEQQGHANGSSNTTAVPCALCTHVRNGATTQLRAMDSKSGGQVVPPGLLQEATRALTQLPNKSAMHGRLPPHVVVDPL